MGMFLIFLAGLVQTAHATDPLTPMVVQSLSERAESVVRGEVLHQRLELNRDGVWTVAMIRVTETLRGAAVPIVEVRVPGGRLADLEVKVARSPQLLPGDDVLLFLKGDRIVGLGEGALMIAQERAWRAMDAWTFIRPHEQDTQSAGSMVQSALSSVTMAAVRAQLSRVASSSERPSSIGN